MGGLELRWRGIREIRVSCLVFFDDRSKNDWNLEILQT